MNILHEIQLSIYKEQADRKNQKIKNLEAENERYREALIKIAEYNHPSNETIQIARDILGVKEPPALEAKCQDCQRHFVMMMDEFNMILLAEGENVQHTGAAFDTPAVFREYLEDDT